MSKMLATMKTAAEKASELVEFHTELLSQDNLSREQIIEAHDNLVGITENLAAARNELMSDLLMDARAMAVEAATIAETINLLLGGNELKTAQVRQARESLMIATDLLDNSYNRLS